MYYFNNKILSGSSRESPPRKKGHLDFEDLINSLNSSISCPSTKEGFLSFNFIDFFTFLNIWFLGRKTETHPRSRSVIKKLPKSNIVRTYFTWNLKILYLPRVWDIFKQAGTTEIEIINEELQQSILNRMEIPKPPTTVDNGHSVMAAVTKQNSQDCKVSDLMEILDNDLFNPR